MTGIGAVDCGTEKEVPTSLGATPPPPTDDAAAARVDAKFAAAGGTDVVPVADGVLNPMDDGAPPTDRSPPGVWVPGRWV